jgi:hypothetical protein
LYTGIPDVKFENKLISLGIDSGSPNGKVLTKLINTLTSLNVASRTIEDLTGIEDFIALTSLNCGRNQLTTLDVSNNVVLVNLSCDRNQLTVLDISKNTALTILNCQNNKLSTIDISRNSVLTSLNVASNKLTVLNLRNRNNTNFNTTALDFKGNDNLFCILVDNPSYSNANWSTAKDAMSIYTTDCSDILYTAIPDENFENKLISEGIDTGTPDGRVPNQYINTLTSLNVAFSEIEDLTGIEDFIALTNLNCGDNQLTDLDLSSTINLETLLCSGNNLSGLNLKNIQSPFLLGAASENPDLSCILVDDSSYSEDNWKFKKDPTVAFATECVGGNPPVGSFISFEDIVLYPNPSKGLMYLDYKDLEEVIISDVFGKQVKTILYTPGENATVIDMTGLSSGLYILVIKSQGNELFRKIVVE